MHAMRPHAAEAAMEHPANGRMQGALHRPTHAAAKQREGFRKLTGSHGTVQVAGVVTRRRELPNTEGGFADTSVLGWVA